MTFLLSLFFVIVFLTSSVLLGSQNYSLTGQAHGGLLGAFQNHVLACMDNLWFDRYVLLP
jgi:hypothetical protein